MKLEDLIHGREAAELMGVSRPDDVWRAVARHETSYSGRLDVVIVGRMKAMPRDQLRAFAAWYDQSVRRSPVMVVSPKSAVIHDERRKALRRALGRIMENDEVME